ncbi:MAG: hypothetical protein K0Q95_1878 [Bacteroidota bacterium]|jgi:hypothetical protein|nr:hypothetical protein [Bacteroidota bacterium]
MKPSSKNFLSSLLFFLFFSPLTFSQIKYNTGSWLVFNSQIRLHEKFSIHAEAQYRDHGLLNEADQILLRGGINYHNSAQSTITAGYARVLNYPADGEFIQTPTINENRVWEQLLLKSTLKRIIFEHRYRLEQRWLNAINSYRYMNRMRYSFRFTIPINKMTLEKKTFFLTLYDEIFINLTSSPFDRNRAYGGIGYQLTPLINIQAGYLTQTVGLYTKQIAQITFTYNVDLRKKD